MNTYQLKKTWHKLTLARELNERLKLSKGDRLADKEFAVLCLIAHHPRITITGIVNHPYFRDTSLSSIKRFVLTLLREQLIRADGGDNDKRERVLTVVEVSND